MTEQIGQGSTQDREQTLIAIVTGMKEGSDPLSDKGGIVLTEENGDLAALAADIEFVVENRFAGSIAKFFETMLNVIRSAHEENDNPVDAVADWVGLEMTEANKGLN